MVKYRGLPNIQELVVVKITEVTQFAAWCNLLEYEAKGMIPISEAAGKWIFDVREVVKEGEVRVAKVIKVEEDKNLVHLSLKRVSKIDEKEKMNEFRKEERGEKLLELATKSLGKSLQQAYEEF
jgi:translation initiation factor 2 subunit 1